MCDKFGNINVIQLGGTYLKKLFYVYDMLGGNYEEKDIRYSVMC